MRGIIYKYTSPSGKSYIGQTNQESKRKYRFENLNQSYGSPKINNARRKYSPENFNYEILFEVDIEDKDELRKILGEQEIIYINQFNTVKNGYNHQEGGLHKTNILNAESRQRAALKVSKPVLQYSITGYFIREWSSTMEIERILEINHTLISQNCLGKTQHCRDFIFKYKENNEVLLNIDISNNFKINKTSKISIIQLDINGLEINRWKSITAASKELHICRHRLKSIAEMEQTYQNYTYKLIK